VPQLAFDQRLADELETVYRSHDVLRRRRIVRDALGARAGERILDVGCGPGFYVAELLGQVGPRGSVVGVDGSPQMLGVAARRCEDHDNVVLHQGDATALPVADAAFDAALSVQVLEYVADASAALAEMHRALRPGGRAVVWDVDWATVSWHATDGARMDRVLRAWDRHLAHPSLPRTLAPRLRSVGFADVRATAHAFAATELVPDAYVGAILPLVERYVTAGGAVGDDEIEAWVAEQQELGRRGEFFFACLQFCFTATRPDRPKAER
jgi:arsenite methyltransferase